MQFISFLKGFFLQNTFRMMHNFFLTIFKFSFINSSRSIGFLETIEPALKSLIN